MNLGVSPDVDCLICYSIVLAVGTIAAVYQLWKNLGGLLGVWTITGAWAVFLVYSGVPVALFWVLDRTGAITDTSFFAALIVGLGYQQILSGQSSLQGPPEAANFWQFLTVWTAQMLPRIRNRMDANNARFRHAVVVSVAADPEKFRSLKQLALTLSPNYEALQKNLDDLEKQKVTLGDQVLIDKQARLLYDEVSPILDSKYSLMTRQIISRSTYWWYAQEYRSKSIGWGVVLVAAILVAGSVKLAHSQHFGGIYYVWRLEKPNASKADRFRTRDALLAMMRDCNDTRLYCRIADALQNDALAPDAIGRATDILIEAQPLASACKIDLIQLMVDDLRNPDPDSRARIQTALEYVATKLENQQVPANFDSWHPSSNDSVAAIDTWIREWRKILPPPKNLDATCTPAGKLGFLDLISH